MEFSNKPLVSVVTPSYNQARFLEKTITSLLNQDYPRIEYIIIDGNSSDGSVDIIKKYADRLSYWVSEPDRGQVDALKKGFKLATGDILGWLNSDDILLSRYVIGDAIALFSKYPQADIVSGSGVFIDEVDKWIRQTRSLPEYTAFRNMRYRSVLIQPATFFTRQVLDALPLDDSLHYVFDWDFFIRAVNQFNLLVVNELWAGYRWWGQNKTASGSSQRVKEQAEVVKRYIGNNAWQYWLLRTFYFSYRVAESLPAFAEKPIKRMTHLSSKTISAITFNHIPVIS